MRIGSYGLILFGMLAAFGCSKTGSGLGFFQKIFDGGDESASMHAESDVVADVPTDAILLAGGEIAVWNQKVDKGYYGAHPSLPLGGYAHVMDAMGERSVIVKITTRSSVDTGQAIVLSYEAAKQLGFLEHGMTRVLIDHYDTLETANLAILNSKTYNHNVSASDQLYKNLQKFAYSVDSENIGDSLPVQEVSASLDMEKEVEEVKNASRVGKSDSESYRFDSAEIRKRSRAKRRAFLEQQKDRIAEQENLFGNLKQSKAEGLGERASEFYGNSQESGLAQPRAEKAAKHGRRVAPAPVRVSNAYGNDLDSQKAIRSVDEAPYMLTGAQHRSEVPRDSMYDRSSSGNPQGYAKQQYKPKTPIPHSRTLQAALHNYAPYASPALAQRGGVARRVSSTHGAQIESGKFLQYAAFSNLANAEKLLSRLQKSGESRVFSEIANIQGKKFYRVRVGPISGNIDLQNALQRAQRFGFDSPRVIAR
jgi:rare lipoprotein A